MPVVGSQAIHKISQMELAKLIEPSVGQVIYSAGTRIFEENDRGNEAYLIHNGYVEISRDINNEKKVIAILGPGEIFGEISVMDGKLRTATAIAIHEITVHPISRRQIQDAMKGEDPLTQLLLQSAFRRLRIMHTDFSDDIEVEELEFESKRDIVFQQTRNEAVNYINSMSKLSAAVENQSFELYYQPIVNLSNGIVNGYEALVRGPKDIPEMRNPQDFIPLLEESGLIIPLGEWILEHSLLAYQLFDKKAQDKNLKNPLFISINVSPRQLDDKDNVESLINIILRSSIDPKCIKLEITENTLLNNPHVAMEALSRLRTIGVLVAIDDFGTGYSSLNYLNRFPLDILKIDRSFINDMFDNDNGKRIVSAIIGLAKQLDMLVVAEGIEKREEMEWLRKQRCELGQGYYFSKPMPIQDAIQLLNKGFS